ncbi:MAG: hypothetical protein AAE983_01360 [Thermoplasmataceae archaeon]|jgi:hypothetical protein
MTPPYSLFERFKNRIFGLELERISRQNKKSYDVSVYSQGKGIFYSLIFSMMLWWIPVAGPAIAGYLGGRKSGTMGKALVSSFVSTAVIIMITLALSPFKTGVLGSTGTYFSTGFLQFSQSNLIAYTGVLNDLYTTYGIIKTLAIIMPGSILLLNIFSFTGGFYSNMKMQEENLSHSFMQKDVENRLSSIRKVPSVKLESRTIKEFNDGSDDDSEYGGSWSYL